MTVLARLTNRAMNLTAAIAALGALVMMAHICAEVVLRTFFDAPIPATVEIVSRYYMVILAFLPIAWLERRRGMVSVEVIEFLLTPRVIRGWDVAVALVSAVIYAGLAYTTWLLALKNYSSGTFVMALEVAVPVWQTYFLPPLGFGLAVLVTLARAITILFGGEAEDVHEALER